MENKMTYVMALDNAMHGVLNRETVEKLGALKIQLASQLRDRLKMPKSFSQPY